MAGEEQVSEAIRTRLGVATRADNTVAFRNRFCWIKGKKPAGV
jgi:hypothetical protein